MTDAVYSVAHAALLTLGLARGDWDLISRGLHDQLHQPRRAHLYPESIALMHRASEFGALGATISGAGPSILFWTNWDATGGVYTALKAAVEQGSTVQRVTFSQQGLDVREL